MSIPLYQMPASTPALLRTRARRAYRRSFAVLAVAALLSNMMFLGHNQPGGAVRASGDASEELQSNLLTSTRTGTGAVCPAGNVKYEDGSGYEYTDDSASITLTSAPDEEKNAASWTVAAGHELVSVCIKIGGPKGGSLVYPDIRAGHAGPYDYDISHVVIRTTSEEKTPPVANPPLGQSCGLDVGLIVDTSGSMSGAEMTQVKNALTEFASAFTGTPTTFSLTTFATNATVTKPFSLTPAGATAAIASDVPATGNGNTNWDAALAKSFSSFDPRPAKPNLIVIATDGSPNRYGDPATATFDWQQGLDHAIARANSIKNAGTRIVVVGIGSDPTDPDYPNTDVKLQSISGPNMAPPGAINPTTDVLKTDFDELGTAMAGLAKSLCGGKVLVQKQLDTNGDGSVDVDGTTPDAKLSGWEFSLGGVAVPTSAKTSTNTGAVEFSALTGTYTVTEALNASMVLSQASCHNGDTVVGTVDLARQQVSNLPMGTDDTISCTFVNRPKAGNLTIIKHVVGGTAKAADFTMHIGDQIAFAGSEDGTTEHLNAGAYIISESGGPAKYSAAFSGDCTTTGEVTLNDSESKTCTITNTFVPDPEYGIHIDKHAPTTVTAGSQLTYTIDWSVSGTAAVTNVTIADPLPVNTVFVSADQGGALHQGSINWSLGTKQPGDHGTVSLVVSVASPLAHATTLTNTACIAATEAAKTCDTVTTATQSAPKLSILKTNTLTSFTNPGATVTYTVVVTNASNATDTARDVVLLDTLPTGFTYVGGATTATYSLGDIAPGASVTKTYQATISAAQPAGTYTNTAEAKGSNTPTVTATSAVDVRVPATLGITAEPQLRLTKTATLKDVRSGDVVLYTLTVANTGDASAFDVVVKDPLPAGMVNMVSGQKSVTWTVGTLAVGVEKSMSFPVKITPTMKAGTVTNIATATATDIDPIQAKVAIVIHQPQVLGLATTGVSLRDYLVFTIGALFLFAGFMLLRRQRLAE